MRGPIPTMSLRPSEYDKIVMVSYVLLYEHEADARSQRVQA